MNTHEIEFLCIYRNEVDNMARRCLWKRFITQSKNLEKEGFIFNFIDIEIFSNLVDGNTIL